jgi:hypothetical protein
MNVLNSTEVDSSPRCLLDFARGNVTLIRKLLNNKTVGEYSISEYRKRARFQYVNPDPKIEEFFRERFTFAEHLITELQEIVFYSVPSNWTTYRATRIAEFIVDCVIHLFMKINNVQ